MEMILCCCRMEKSYFPDIDLLDALGYGVVGFCDGAPERIGIAHDVIGLTNLPPDETILVGLEVSGKDTYCEAVGYYVFFGCEIDGDYPCAQQDGAS